PPPSWPSAPWTLHSGGLLPCPWAGSSRPCWPRASGPTSWATPSWPGWSTWPSWASSSPWTPTTWSPPPPPAPASTPQSTAAPSAAAGGGGRGRGGRLAPGAGPPADFARPAVVGRGRADLLAAVDRRAARAGEAGAGAGPAAGDGGGAPAGRGRAARAPGGGV